MMFSIITPSFRNSEWLKLCIASVADQEGVKFEHIVQDACSDDGTLEWLPNDKRVKAFIEKDSGMYDAINRGLRRATGDILAYLNCDEQYLPGALQSVAIFFKDHPDIDVVLAGSIVVNGECNYMCHRPSLIPTLNLIWHRFPALTSSIFFRRSVIEKKNIYFNTEWKISGDKIWFIDLLKQNIKIKVLNIYTSISVDNGENLVLTNRALEEKKKTLKMAPQWTNVLKPFLIAMYRVQRLMAGHFNIRETSYSIYTKSSPGKRCMFNVQKPSSIWWNRM